MADNTNNVSYFSDLTKKGYALYNKVQRGICGIEITRVVIGSGELLNGQRGEDITAVKQPVDVDVIIGDITDVKDGTTVMSVTLGNARTDYYLREIGVYAADPDEGEILYCYTNYRDGADFVKTYNGVVPEEISFDIYIAIGAGELIVNPTVSEEQTLKAHIENKNNPHGVTLEQLGLHNADVLSDITVNSKSMWTEGYAKRHTHPNINILNAITAAVAAAWDDAYKHTFRTDNPHNISAAQIGLGNVTNESKATMFKNAHLTGEPTAPTAAAGTISNIIASTAFVAAAIATITPFITAIIDDGFFTDEFNITDDNIPQFLPGAIGGVIYDQANGIFKITNYSSKTISQIYVDDEVKYNLSCPLESGKTYFALKTTECITGVDHTDGAISIIQLS